MATYSLLLLVSLICILSFLVRDLLWSRSRSTIGLFALFAVGVAFYFFAWRGNDLNIVDKGTADDQLSPTRVLILLASMLLGMIAQYFYTQVDSRGLKWRDLLRPMLASPILFIPIAASMPLNTQSFAVWSFSGLMSILIAFQTGFFWRALFEFQANTARSRERE